MPSDVKNAPVACAPQAQNIAVRRCRRTKPVRVHGQDRRAQPPMDSGAISSGDLGFDSIALRAASPAERQRPLPEAATHLITSQCLRGSFRGKISEGGPEPEPEPGPEPEPKARAVMGHVKRAAHSSRSKLTTAPTPTASQTAAVRSAAQAMTAAAMVSKPPKSVPRKQPCKRRRAGPNYE